MGIRKSIRAGNSILKSGLLDGSQVNKALCQLFDFIPNVQFWIKDRQGRYRWINRGFLMNYSLDRPEQVLGKTDFDLSPRYLAAQYLVDDDSVLKGQAVTNRVELVGRFDHTACWSVTTKVQLRNSRGKITGTAGITHPLQEKGHTVVASSVLGRLALAIKDRYPDALTNQQMAKAAGLSVRALERRFKRSFGVTPHEYVRRLRVRMACYELVYSRATLVNIAATHGFYDQSHFTREFRHEVGMTPRQYQIRYRSPAT